MPVPISGSGGTAHAVESGERYSYLPAEVRTLQAIASLDTFSTSLSRDLASLKNSMQLSVANPRNQHLVEAGLQRFLHSQMLLSAQVAQIVAFLRTQQLQQQSDDVLSEA
jgi:hypothetical protein